MNYDNTKAYEVATAAGINIEGIALSGTEKQVKFAHDLIARAVADILSTYKLKAAGIALLAQIVNGYTAASEVIDIRLSACNLLTALKAAAARRNA